MRSPVRKGTVPSLAMGMPSNEVMMSYCVSTCGTNRCAHVQLSSGLTGPCAPEWERCITSMP